MKSLADALKSGDLDAAKEAYTALTKTLEEDQTSSSSTQDSRKQKLTDMLSQVGDALNSGDISKAQEAFKSNAPPPPPSGAQGGPPPDDGGPSEDVMKGMASLADALKSGDLSSAKDAYASLTDLLSSDNSSTSETSSSDAATSGKAKLQSALADIGKALQSGDLTSAQKLFSSMTPRGQNVDTVA